MHKPTIDHWVVVRQILQYIKYTTNCGLHIAKNTNLSLQVFMDFDGQVALMIEIPLVVLLYNKVRMSSPSYLENKNSGTVIDLI